MANNNAFGNIDMTSLLNSGLDLSMLNSLSGMNQPQQRPPMPMQGQGPPVQNMGGMQGMNMNILGNGGPGRQPNMGGSGMGNGQQPNNGMTNAQLLDVYQRMQAQQMAQQMQNRGTPTMGSTPQMPRLPSGQFPNGHPQQQQGDHYNQLQRLLATKNTAGALQNPMRPPFNQQASNEMLQENRNNGQNVMNPNLAATQQQLRQVASQNATHINQIQQTMQQHTQQNRNQNQNQNHQQQNQSQTNINNAGQFNGLFPGQTNPQNQYMPNNLTSGQKPGPSPQMQNAQQQQIRPMSGMPQSSPHAPGRPLPPGVPQNLLELNHQFQQLNDQQRQQLMSLYQHQGRAQNAFSNQMTPRTLSQSLQSVGNPNSSPIPANQPNQGQNTNLQVAQSQAMAAAQQRAHLAQQAQQAANTFGNNHGVLGNPPNPQGPGGGNAQGPRPGQPGNNLGPGPGPQNGPAPRTFSWDKVSDAQLIETGKGMLPKLAAQIKALQSTPQNSPQRATMENQIRNNNQIRMTFMQEMRRRNLDLSLVGGTPQQAQLATPQVQNQSLVPPNAGSTGLPNNVNSMQVDPQARQGMNMPPGTFPNAVPPRPTPNEANDSGVAANGLPKATTPQGRAIQEAVLVMPRQKFTEIVGSIYRNSRKSEIPPHKIENRPLDLYALFTTVAKFGGCAEVSSKDIWSMVGGLMGYVHNAGPPPISSAEVARQLQQIYSEALHVIEGHYLSVIVKQRKENVAALQSRMNQGQTVSAGAPGSKNGREVPPHPMPGNNDNQLPFPASSANTSLVPSADTGGFTLDQLTKLATAAPPQLANYNLTPEQMNIVQRHRVTLLSAYQQKAAGMRPPGSAPTVPANGPNAKGEWVVKGHVITPQDYEKGKQIVGKMYNTHIASIHLNHEQIPEAERANYQKQITNAMQMLKSFDHILTLEFAMRPERQNDSEIVNLYKVAGLLRRAASKWVTEHVAMLKAQVLSSAFNKVAVETNKIRKTHLSDPPPPAPAQIPVATQAPHFSERSNQAVPAGSAAGADTNGVIAPRLRVEDLKPPPSKRQKQNNDKSSPATTVPRGISVGTDGNPPTPTLAQNATVSSPTIKKLPRPKPTRRKPSMAAALKPDMTPSKQAEKPPSAVDASVPDSAPEVSLSLPQFTGLADPPAQGNSLGISFRQMGVAAVSAYKKEEQDGRVDPLSFLEISMSKLENAMRNSAQAFPGLERDLSFSFTPDVQEVRFDPSLQTQPQLQRRPNEQEASFDYSSFIDESAFGFGDGDEDTPDKLKDLQLPAETPELLMNPLGQVDPSPTSVVAITPHCSLTSMAEYGSTYSPKPRHVEYPLGEDGWLDNLGLDPSYWTS